MRVLILLQSVGHLGGTNVQLKRVAEAMRQKKIHVDHEVLRESYDLIILPTSEIKRVALIFNVVSIKKVLIWALGYGAFFEAFIPAKLRNKFLSKSLAMVAEKLAVRNILYFSDISGMSRDIGKATGLSDDSIIPISVDLKPTKVSKQPHWQSSERNYVWLGRLSYDFKFLSIKRIIEDLNDISKNSSLEYSLDIVGDGEALSELKDIATRSKFVNVEFRGELPLATFENLAIENNYNAIISMGTSVLEGARLGINSIIVMPMMSQEDYRRECSYRFVYDSVGYSMGEFSDDTIQTNYPLNVVLSKLTVATARNCKKYSKNFSVDKIADILIKSGGIPNLGVKIFFYSSYVFFKIKYIMKR